VSDTKVYYNTSSRIIDVQSGQIVPTGERVELKLDNEHDQALVASGVLVAIPQKALDHEAKLAAKNPNQGGDS
jgi:hypothetical protein